MNVQSSSAINEFLLESQATQEARLFAPEGSQHFGMTGPASPLSGDRVIKCNSTGSFLLPDSAIFDVCSYIIFKCGPISVSRLQLLVYYSYVWTLVWDDKELFQCDILAGINGPLIKPLYDYYKGDSEISDSIIGSSCNLTEEDRDSIDTVLSAYSQYKTGQLIEISQKERPWRLARGNSRDFEYTPVMKKEAILEYYRSLISEDNG